jgi:hypothetical protein
MNIAANHHINCKDVNHHDNIRPLLMNLETITIIKQLRHEATQEYFVRHSLTPAETVVCQST